MLDGRTSSCRMVDYGLEKFQFEFRPPTQIGLEVMASRSLRMQDAEWASTRELATWVHAVVKRSRDDEECLYPFLDKSLHAFDRQSCLKLK